MRGDDAHRYAQRLHALRRLYQRHGFAMNTAEYQAACEKITRGDCPVVGNGRNGGTLHVIKHRGRDIVAIYSPLTQQIVTFLPSGTPTEMREAAE